MAMGGQVQELVSRARARVARTKANLPGPGMGVLSRSPGLIDRFPMAAQAKGRLQTKLSTVGRGAMAQAPAVRTAATPAAGRRVKTV